MAAKLFEVGDVLPATTQLEISWYIEYAENESSVITTTSSYLYIMTSSVDWENNILIRVNGVDIVNIMSSEDETGTQIIDTSSWSVAQRTVTYCSLSSLMDITWEDLNAQPSGFSITFEENGGSTVTDLTEQTTLPSPLPTTTKANHVFAGWYYDNLFTQKAVAGATIESNVTLYAKWYTPTTWCEDIADAIREKEGSSGNIKHVDFPDRIEALPSPKEEQTKTVSPTTSSQDVLPDGGKVLSKVTVSAIPTETKSQQPSLESGNQVINATSGKFMTSFTITKDTTNHIASNIRSGKTLYGVAGSLQPAKEEETKTVTPNFASGNVVVTPTSGKVLSQVTFSKDTTNHKAENIKKDITLYGVTGTLESGGGEMPSTSSQNIFTGATIPLTYKDNTHDYENNYEYKSNSHNITVTGLDGRATITGNGTKSVTVAFDVTSATSSLKNFTITCVNGEQTLEYKGLHAHYGTTVTGILTFAFVNITKDGSEGTIGTNYKFIVTDAITLPIFGTGETLWNTIYSYQVMNVLMGNYSSTSIGDSFLRNCYSFNQPLTIPSDVTSIGPEFLSYCYSFNQPLTIPSDVTSIGNSFLYNCRSFNQPLTIPSDVTSIGSSFLSSCSTFNQPLTIPSDVTSIGPEFLSYCYSFNQPLTIPSDVASIGNSFLYNCYSFNQPLTIPSDVTSIGPEFLSYCYSFNQPLTIPSDVTSIGSSFLRNCYSLSILIYNATAYPTDSNSLSQSNDSKTSSSGAGIIVYGTKRAELMSALANRTSSPYRKLINGGS